MLNKLFALLLSAGLLLSPLNVADSPSLASGELTANVAVTVGKQQSNYEKHRTDTISYDGYTLSFPSGFSSCSASQGYYYYSFDEVNGMVSGIGSIQNIPRDTSCTFYSITSGKNIKMVIQDYDSVRDTYSQKWTGGAIWKAQLQKEVCGDYLAEVTADTGSLPDDGKHTDGYWYVFKKLVED